MDSDYLTNWKKYRETVRKKYAESREASPKRDVPNLNISDVPSGVLSPRRAISPRRLLDFSGSRISNSSSVLKADKFLKKVPYELQKSPRANFGQVSARSPKIAAFRKELNLDRIVTSPQRPRSNISISDVVKLQQQIKDSTQAEVTGALKNELSCLRDLINNLI